MSRIRKIEVTGMFWKELAKWRKIPEYPKIRAQIADLVQKVSNGEFGGDEVFQGGKHWNGIRHLHVAAKLVVFTAYPDDETLKLCTIAKHDFYGFRGERSHMAQNASQRIHNAMAKEPVPSPEWSGIKWSDPAELLTHPELRELSLDAMRDVLQDIMEESDTFERLRAATAGMSPVNEKRVAEAWLDDLVRAQEHLETVIMETNYRREKHLEVRDFEPWLDGPG